jgi:hypothetical protein
MAITSNTYTGNGTNKLFSITFPYLDTSDINVYLNGVLQTIITQYTFANATTVEFVTAPGNGAVVLLDRSTDDSTLQATFFPGSSIKANDLNFNFDQVLYLSQETANSAANQSTAGLQTQITAANNTSNTALTSANAANVTANTANTTANGIAGTAASAVTTANNAVTTANNAVTTANGAVSTANSALSTVSGLSGVNLNRIINGNFDFWQRGTSFTGSEYGADRWVHRRVGTTHTATRQAFTLGQTDVPSEPQYFCRTVVSSVAGAANFSRLDQQIESVRTFAGQQITFSFWAKADTTKNISVQLQQAFGSGGSPSAEVNFGVTKVSIGTSWQKVTVTATAPSISGKTLGTGNNDSLVAIIWFDAGSSFNSATDTLGQQSGTFDIAQVQVEAGAAATPFEQRPIGTELALCQRYYQHTIVVRIGGLSASGIGFHGGDQFLTEMRTTPTMVQRSPVYVGGTSGLYATPTSSTTFLFDTANYETSGIAEAYYSASAEL